MHLHKEHIDNVTECFFIGSPLSQGLLPAIFYFFTSAEESLLLDPFNQPVEWLSHMPLRVFSLSLPGHPKGAPLEEALGAWVESVRQGKDPLESFIPQVKLTIDHLVKKGAISLDNIAVFGLSRGAFAAAHVAAEIPSIHSLLGFAPLTDLGRSIAFKDVKDHLLIDQTRLIHLSQKLYNRNIRFYISNRDVKVSTRSTFDCIEAYAETAHLHHKRASPIELILTPPIGRDGHGTDTSVFHEGARWLAKQCGV